MKLLTTLYQIQSKTGHEKAISDFICAWIEKYCPEARIEADKKGNLYVTKGSGPLYPCVASHLDQVQQPRDIKVVIHEGIVMGYCKKDKGTAGLGADDKNGIWICLKCLLKFDTIKLVFFVEEETGCQGSHVSDLAFFDDAKFVIQCDRKGNSDFITTACGVKLCNEDWLNVIRPLLKEHHYTECLTGGLTDVKTLRSRGLKVCSCNISCGYYNPHSDYETTDIGDLINCKNLVEDIITTCQDKFEFPPEPIKTYTYPSSNWDPHRTIDYWDEVDSCFYPRRHKNVDKNSEEFSKERSEQLSNAKNAIKDYILNTKYTSPYTFFYSNQNLFTALEYEDICKIFAEVRNELPIKRLNN